MGAGCCKSDQGVGLDQSSIGSQKPLDYENGNQTTQQDQGQECDHFLKNHKIAVNSQIKEDEEDTDIPKFKDIQKYYEFVSEGCEIQENQPEMTNDMICLMLSQYGKFKYYKKQFECTNSIYCPPTKIPDGSIYFGQWLNRSFHGRGKLTTEEDCIYEGYFNYGKKQGYGRMLFSSGDYYQGEWFDDQMEGQGILILRDGSQFQGYFYQSIYIGNQKGMKFEDKVIKETQEQEISTTKKIINENQSQYENSIKMNGASATNIEGMPKKQQSQFKKFQEQQVNVSSNNSQQNNNSNVKQDDKKVQNLQQENDQAFNLNEEEFMKLHNKLPSKGTQNRIAEIQHGQQQQQQQQKSGSLLVDYSLEKNGRTNDDHSVQKSQLQQENFEDFKNNKQEQMKNLSLQKNSQFQISGVMDNKPPFQLSQMNFTRREEENGTAEKQSLNDNDNDENEDGQSNSRNSSMISLKYERRMTKCGDRLVNLYADIDRGLEINNIEFNEILQKYLESVKLGNNNNNNGNSDAQQQQMDQSMIMISFQQLLPKNMKQKMAYFQELLQLNNFHHDDVQGRVIDQMDFQTFRIYQQKQIYKILQNKQDQSDQQYKKKVLQQNEILEKELMKKIISRGDQMETYKHVALLGLKQIYEKQGVLVRLIQQKDERNLNDNDKNFNAVKQHLIQSGFVMQNYYSATLSELSEWKYELAINDKRKFCDYIKKIILESNKELENKDIILLGIVRGDYGQIKVDFYVKNEVIPIMIDTINVAEIKECKQFPIIDEITLNIDSFFDTKWNMVWDSSIFSQYRGNINGQKQQYYRPNGYFGSALKVINKYPNDGWINNDTSDKTWIVLFHGSKKQSSQELIAEGYKQGGYQQYQGHNCRFGRGVIKQGIYFYDQIQEAEKQADIFFINEKQYYLLFQCRVNPKTVKSPINKPSCYIASDPKDVRPYRIIIKEVSVNTQEELSNV